LACAAWTFGYGSFLNSVVKLRFIRIDLQSLYSVEGIAGYLFFTAFLAALFFPFYFKLGLGFGVLIFAGACLALGNLFLVFEFLATDALHLTGPLSMPEFLKHPGLGILRAIGGIKTSLGVPLFVGALLVLTAGMVLASIRLSIRFYEKREF